MRRPMRLQEAIDLLGAAQEAITLSDPETALGHIEDVRNAFLDWQFVEADA